MLEANDWEAFARRGFLRLGQVLTVEEIEALQKRADDLAMGNVKNPDVQMQLDTGGDYEKLPAVVSHFQEGTRFYRKIQGLENDPLFLRLIQTPVFLEVCAKIYGNHAGISIFRAMIMNKPAGQGTSLPWHQDGGTVWALDRDPLITIWVALDPATQANGCMECVPGSHRLGLLSQFGSTISDENVNTHCPSARVHPLEVKPGNAVLIHNWLIHRSGVNPSPGARRAFTMCCMDARTRSTLTGRHFPIIAGDVPAEHDPYVGQLMQERTTFRQRAEEGARYAESLLAENQVLRNMRVETEKYALSLEAERDRLLNKVS